MLRMKHELKTILNGAGIPAEYGGDWKLGKVIRDHGVYISLRQISGTEGALHQYLGTDAQGNELYGMALELKFALVLLSPKEQGISGAEAFGEETMNAVLGAMQQLGAREILCSEAKYDALRDCFRQEITVDSQVMAYGVETNQGICLTEFRVQALVL